MATPGNGGKFRNAHGVPYASGASLAAFDSGWVMFDSFQIHPGYRQNLRISLRLGPNERHPFAGRCLFKIGVKRGKRQALPLRQLQIRGIVHR